MRINLPHSRFAATMSYIIGNLDVFSHVTYRFSPNTNPLNPVTKTDLDTMLDRFNEHLSSLEVSISRDDYPDYKGDFRKGEDGYYYLKDRFTSKIDDPRQNYTLKNSLISDTANTYPKDASPAKRDSLGPVTGEFSLSDLNRKTLPARPWSIPGDGFLGVYVEDLVAGKTVTDGMLEGINYHRTIPEYLIPTLKNNAVVSPGVIDPKAMYTGGDGLARVHLFDSFVPGEIGLIPPEVKEDDYYRVRDWFCHDHHVLVSENPTLTKIFRNDDPFSDVMIDHGNYGFGNPGINATCGEEAFSHTYNMELRAAAKMGNTRPSTLPNSSLGIPNPALERGSSSIYSEGKLYHIHGSAEIYGYYDPALAKGSKLTIMENFLGSGKGTERNITLMTPSYYGIGATTLILNGEPHAMFGGQPIKSTSSDKEKYNRSVRGKLVNLKTGTWVEDWEPGFNLYGAVNIVHDHFVYILGGVYIGGPKALDLDGTDIYLNEDNFNTTIYRCEITPEGLSKPEPYMELPVGPGVCYRNDIQGGVSVVINNPAWENRFTHEQAGGHWFEYRFYMYRGSFNNYGELPQPEIVRNSVTGAGHDNFFVSLNGYYRGVYDGEPDPYLGIRPKLIDRGIVTITSPHLNGFNQQVHTVTSDAPPAGFIQNTADQTVVNHTERLFNESVVDTALGTWPAHWAHGGSFIPVSNKSGTSYAYSITAEPPLLPDRLVFRTKKGYEAFSLTVLKIGQKSLDGTLFDMSLQLNNYVGNRAFLSRTPFITVPKELRAGWGGMNFIFYSKPKSKSTIKDYMRVVAGTPEGDPDPVWLED